MKKNIEDYIIIFPEVLSKKFCEESIAAIKTGPWKEHTFSLSHYKRGNTFMHKDEPEVIYSEEWCNRINEIIIDKLYPIIQQYIDLLNFSWFHSWQGYSAIKFNRYLQNNKMANHCDHIHDMFDGDRRGIPILSIIGLLNNDFEGGKLIMCEDITMNMKQGDILIFPSNFLYPHKVEPVTKGIRYTYVSWVW